MPKSGVRWYYDTLTPSLQAFPLVTKQALDSIMERMATEVESYAQTNAPWGDVSGDARQGLTAEYDPDSTTIILYHTVEYGPYLEVKWSGQYAIIIPTIEAMGPVVMAELGGLF